MSQALTETTWRVALQRIVNTTGDDTTRTLAKMLLDIIKCPTDIDEVLDAYGSRLLGEKP
jgi:hypothetical protein